MKLKLRDSKIIKKHGVSCNDVAKAIYDEIDKLG